MHYELDTFVLYQDVVIVTILSCFKVLVNHHHQCAGLSMLLPHLPILRYPLPDGTLPVAI